jgi:hypothetical protein
VGIINPRRVTGASSDDAGMLPSVLTADDRVRVQRKARAAIDKATLRTDAWWLFPLSVGALLVVLIGYLTIAGLQTTNYFVEPYLSPLYSPCLAANCEHVTFAVLGPWFSISPFLLVGWLPISFRITCYYYRKAYYRSFFLSPPACSVKEPARKYHGENRFPHVLVQNLHRYFFYLMIVNMVFLTWDTIKTFFFPDGFGVGVGTLVFVVMIATMSLYMLSCHSCRHAIGGHVNRFSGAPVRYRAWKVVTRLNKSHGLWALASLVWIGFTDVYVRLVATGVITDLRLF